MSERELGAKIVSVIASSVLGGILFIAIPLSSRIGSFSQAAIFISLVCAIAAVLGLIFGVPGVMLVDRFLPRFKARHVVAAPICALLAWLAFEGAFSPGAWSMVWTSPSFWFEWAPRRAGVMLFIGLAVGACYMLIWPRIGRLMKVSTAL
ncbi:MULTISPECIES: hypothetical protein [Stenotrophomonas]|uniref:hypothetical protein n=1 Tax=Stenotrophomonas sp. CC22-02 TaxID=1378087 RepID=UPI0010628FFE|nr:hypothetical protein [Stenotrophomonas sp. CC22-02]